MVADREEGLEQQRVGAERGEERLELRVTCDRGALACVDGLVGIDAQLVDLPDAECGGDEQYADQIDRDKQEMAARAAEVDTAIAAGASA